MHEHEITGRTNFLILCMLLMLTALTVFVAFQDMGRLNNVVAIGIAVIKSALVIWFFMHVKFASRFVRVGIFSSLLFMLLLFGFVMADVMTRGWLGVPGK